MPWFMVRMTPPARSCTAEPRRLKTMKARDRKFSVKLVSLAVRGALVATIAAPPIVWAQDAGNDDVTALTLPTNFLQVGGNDNSDSSDNFAAHAARPQR